MLHHAHWDKTVLSYPQNLHSSLQITLINKHRTHKHMALHRLYNTIPYQPLWNIHLPVATPRFSQRLPCM